MRRACVLMVTMLVWGSTAQAQLLWAGVGAGTAWEWQSRLGQGEKFTHVSGAAPAAFVAFPLFDDTFFRVRGAEIRHDVLFVNTVVEGKIQALTVGVDYFMAGGFGTSVFSAGLGAYSLSIERADLKDLEGRTFGWYVGIGEWFDLSRRARVTTEVLLHRTDHFDKPIIVTATVGLAFSF